jgi:uncharacterized protein (DUF58 family)
MIVPSPRLLRDTAVLGTALAVGWALRPDYGWAVVGVAMFAAALVAVDALLSRRSLEQVRVAFPNILRLAHLRSETVSVPWESPRPLRCPRLVLDWPTILKWNQDSPTPAGASRGVATWKVLPLARGQTRVRYAAMVANSFLGWWEIRRRWEPNVVVKVLPDLHADRRRLAARFFAQTGAGPRLRRLPGRGREFEQLRDYIPGDPVEDISWKASARRRTPVTKLYRVERTQEIYVALDTSRLSGRFLPSSASDAAPPCTVLDRTITAALLLATAARDQGDRFGVIAYDRLVHRFLAAGQGREHLRRVMDLLLDLRPSAVSADPVELFSFLRARLRRRALVVVMASLDDAAAIRAYQRGSDLVARHHLVLTLTIRPEGATPVFTGPPPDSVEEMYRQMDRHEQWRRLDELRRSLARHGVDLVVCPEETLVVTAIERYLDAKERLRL